MGGGACVGVLAENCFSPKSFARDDVFRPTRTPMVSAVKLRRNQLIVTLVAQGVSTASVVAEVRRARLSRVSLRQDDDDDEVSR